MPISPASRIQHSQTLPSLLPPAGAGLRPLMVVFDEDHRTGTEGAGSLLHRRHGAGNTAVCRDAAVSGGMPHPLADFYFYPPAVRRGEGGSGALPQRDAQPVGLPFLDGKRGGERLVFLLAGGMTIPPLKV